MKDELMEGGGGGGSGWWQGAPNTQSLGRLSLNRRNKRKGENSTAEEFKDY